ncbi:hypothetical protein C1857_08420 [Eggerthella lenta]|nr:hypothetical protein C1857_08420 [Eggerthella lenta]
MHGGDRGEHLLPRRRHVRLRFRAHSAARVLHAHDVRGGRDSVQPVRLAAVQRGRQRMEHRLRHPCRGTAVRREEGGRGVVNGKLMKERRKALGMTQMQLAVAVGASSVALVSSWERGCTVASVPKLKKLAEVLGVTMEQLLEEEE